MEIKKTLEQILAEHNKGCITKRRCKQEESRMQCSCIKWFRLQYPHLSHALFAVPNGAYFAHNGAKEGARMKAEGLLPGVADLILLHYNGRCGALCIEMKTRIGRQAETQKAWQEKIEKDGYQYVICRSFEDFRDAITNYLKD